MSEVMYHRLRYFLSPQLDLYRRVADEFPNAETVLDVGCGTGFGTLQLMKAGRTVMGLEIDEEAVHFCRETIRAFPVYHPEEAVHLAFSWDLVTAIEVVEHAPDPKAFLWDLLTLAAPGGRVIVSTPNVNGRYVKNHAHVREYDPVEFLALCKEVNPNVRLYDGHLNPLGKGSFLTPMVAIWTT